MKTLRLLSIVVVLLLVTGSSLLAADAAPPPATWHAQTLLQAIGNVLVFSLVGIIAAILGYKIFDKCTPGHLTREILEHRNIAAAIIGGAVILGVCIIVAAAMAG